MYSWPSSGVSCRTREPTLNFEPRLLVNPCSDSDSQQDTLRNGYECWFTKFLRDNNLVVVSSILTRRVTIQEYLTLVPSYG